MTREERAIFKAEQEMLGYRMRFKDRWDHHLALEALSQLPDGRRRFDLWATDHLTLITQVSVSVAVLVVRFLALHGLAHGEALEKALCRRDRKKKALCRRDRKKYR